MHLAPDQPIGRPSFELSEDQLATVVDLLCTGIELLSQLGQGLFTLDRGQGHLRLERRCVIPAGVCSSILLCSAILRLPLKRTPTHTPVRIYGTGSLVDILW